MVRNSNTIYRLVKLNQNQYPTSTAAVLALGAADCQPFNLPVYCAVPVNTGTHAHAFDRPIGAYFSLDGTSAYVLNCGQECGGTTSSVTYLQQGVLQNNHIPTTIPDTSSFITQVLVPGGATALSRTGPRSTSAGQQLQPDGLFAGNLTTISLATNTVTGKYSISDGTHTKMLFADNNTLWIGSQYCATGERAHQAALGVTTQAANYNCLTRFDLGTLTPAIVPFVTPGSPTAVVQFPNTNQNQYYYGDLTGLCWVQGFNKMYTAYGGQVHVFSTADSSEIDNKTSSCRARPSMSPIWTRSRTPTTRQCRRDEFSPC